MKDMNEFEGDVELLVNGTETLFIDGSNLAKVHSSKFQSVFKNEDEVETESGIKINAEVVLDGDGNEYKQDFYSPTPGVTVEVISNTALLHNSKAGQQSLRRRFRSVDLLSYRHT